MVSDQRTFGILQRQFFINTCTFLMTVVVVPEVSAPYSRTVFTFVLKIFTLILVDSSFELHMFFNCRSAAVALPILTCTPASNPLCSSMVLPRYVIISTSSRAPPSSEIVLVSCVMYLRMLLFALCMLRPIAAEAAAKLVVFIGIYACVWNRRARTSAKSESSSCIQVVHCIPCFPLSSRNYRLTYFLCHEPVDYRFKLLRK
ncbi:unnamed protein product [Schistosoma intercalatum]|nr:unnamed protein product [Schistosoma intercalatum]CAH8471031.1 unnamed protein product [Schistosoma intercalatum]